MDESQQHLREYAESGSEDAFRRLVELHLGLVRSTALRSLAGDAALAADCAQLVFADLARRAKRIPRNAVLAGWLYRHTWFTASKLARGESRRRQREREAATMNPGPQEIYIWSQLQENLDEALSSLTSGDRDAVLLRFFQQQDLRSVASALEVSESAAQKRVERAIEKLRIFFKQRGVTVSAGALGTALAVHTVMTPSASMAAAIAAGALSQVASGVGLISSVLFMSKLKVLTVGAVVITGVATPLYWQYQTISRLAAENLKLRTQASPQPVPPPLIVTDLERTDADRRELIRLRGELALLRREQAKAQAAVATEKAPIGVDPQSPQELSEPRGFVSSASWTDAGFSSPGAAVQTAHWAVRNANAERFKQSMVITEDARKVLNGLLEQMKRGAPPEALQEVERRGWGLEEGLLFPMIAQDRKQGYTGYRVLSQRAGQGDEVLLDVQLEMDSAPPQTQTYRMKQFEGEWKRMYDLDSLPLPDSLKQKVSAAASQ